MRIAAILLAVAAAPAVAQPALLPTPARMTPAGEGFALGDGIRLVANDAGERNAAERLAGLMRAYQVTPGPIGRDATGPAIRFRRTPGLAAEGYRLAAGPNGATIEASDDAGLVYGAVTLWQLATEAPGGRIAGIRIEDAPRFGWRGIMLDSARHFRSPEFVKRLIDAMFASKLNRLHWHLVDDQAWRMPVPGWPKLTEVSAWRHTATAPGAPQLPRIGGFYTEEQIREIVAYASARGITVVPEIEMPGHALAAIRAYPELGMGVPIPPGTESDYGVFPWLYNVEDGTFRFLEAVLDQTMRLFPSRWIHAGGDEAVKDQWRASPAIQARIRQLGLKDEEALQGWFMARIGRYLAAHGRRMIGWDEVLEGGVPADTTITSWRGVEGAVTAAKRGHDAILSPAPTLYLDNRQGSGPAEPPGRGNLITLDTVLAFDPVPPGLSPAEAKHILGLQANQWAEHVRTDDRAAWMIFPRALAIAETGWAGPAKRTAATFARQALPQVDRLRRFGIVAADSAWAVTAKADPAAGDRITVTLESPAKLPLRYTLDGREPDTSSALYERPLTLSPGQRVRAATFLDTRALPGALDQTFTALLAHTRTSRDLTLCSSGAALDLEDDSPATGPRAHFLVDILNPCWRWDKAPLRSVSRVALHVGQVPFNFQIGKDRDAIRFRTPRSPAGEFELRDGCDGPLMATLPLAPAMRNPGVTRLEAKLSHARDTADLCVTYTARGVDPLWVIDRVELLR